MNAPDYIIIGAMKCGTSTLAAQLGAQPGVFMTTPKEPNFFSDDAIFSQGERWYERLFESAAPTDLKGEASTHYTKLPDYPRTLPRLKQALGTRLKIIYLIRDPLQRLTSHYIHEWTEGVMTGDINTAVSRHPALINYSLYAMQLRPWLDTFGHEHVHVDTLEAMQSDPIAFIRRIGRFLDRDDLHWQPDLDRQNVSAERIRRHPLDGLLINNPVATLFRRLLIPQSIRDRVKAKRRMTQRPTLTEDTRSKLITLFQEDHCALQALLPNRPDLDSVYASIYRPPNS